MGIFLNFQLNIKGRDVDLTNSAVESFNVYDCDNGESVNPCDDEPCMNGGTCHVDGLSFKCQCTSRYSGLTCDTCMFPPKYVSMTFLFNFITFRLYSEQF